MECGRSKIDPGNRYGQVRTAIGLPFPLTLIVPGSIYKRRPSEIPENPPAVSGKNDLLPSQAGPYRGGRHPAAI